MPRISYARVCLWLNRLGRWIGFRDGRRYAFLKSKVRRDWANEHSQVAREQLARNLFLASMKLEVEDIETAGITLTIVCFGLFIPAAAIAFILECAVVGLVSIALMALVPLLLRKVFVCYPAIVAEKRTKEVLKHSSEATNLMIMSLRHEPSISNAISFASNRDDAFCHELRGCIWSVIMGKYESFEEALLGLGRKWVGTGDDLRTSLNSMITSSREATQEGRRRALDRANSAMISGGKRRIELYAMSLSTPSMLIFGLGILLPLMVGAFLPMLSWNLWSMEDFSPDAPQTQSQSSLQMVFIMNILFPAIAILVAGSAVANHPLSSGGPPNKNASISVPKIAVVLAVSASMCTAIWYALGDSVLRSVLMLFSAVGPTSAWFLLNARSSHEEGGYSAGDLEDILFRTGARMLEGENLESSMHSASKELAESPSAMSQMLSLREILGVERTGTNEQSRQDSFGVQNVKQGFNITRQAAAKDEPSAGMLAMDLASYLKDLRDLESNLKNRIKPTISMMKMTALILAPIVLGVTYAIYVSLASMLGGLGASNSAGLFFIVLGLFLAQMDAVVAYFVWGIDGRKDITRLTSSIGAYVMVSEAAYSATALIASA